ncbi:MAG TPA: HNH endonuclease [Planctomycetota bacterium]|jgi:hypothetical protein
MAEFTIRYKGSEQTVLVDDEDLPILQEHTTGWQKWRIMPSGKSKLRVIRFLNDGPKDKPTHTLLLHRFLLGLAYAPSHIHVDHINGNPLDNRKCNLRMATNAQNLMNTTKRPGCRSRFKGVALCKGRKSKPWQASLGDHTHSFIGRFATEEEAARAYDRAAQERYGSFAILNFPLVSQ